jgi:hypothetical protein
MCEREKTPFWTGEKAIQQTLRDSEEADLRHQQKHRKTQIRCF